MIDSVVLFLAYAFVSSETSQLNLKAIPSELYISGQAEAIYQVPDSNDLISNLDSSQTFVLLNFNFLTEKDSGSLIEAINDKARIQIDLSGAAEYFVPPFVVNAQGLKLESIKTESISESQNPFRFKTILKFEDPYPVTSIEIDSLEPLRVSDFEELLAPLFVLMNRRHDGQVLPCAQTYFLRQGFLDAFARIHDRASQGESVEVATMSVIAGRPWVQPKFDPRISQPATAGIQFTGESTIADLPWSTGALQTDKSQPIFLGLRLPF